MIYVLPKKYERMSTPLVHVYLFSLSETEIYGHLHSVYIGHKTRYTSLPFHSRKKIL